MTQRNIQRPLGAVERRLVIVPHIGGFAAPQAGLRRQQLAVLDNVLECAQLVQPLADFLIHRRRTAMVLGVGVLHRAELEQVQHLGAVR